MSDRLSAKALKARMDLLEAIENPPENFVYDWGNSDPRYTEHDTVEGCALALGTHLGINHEDLELPERVFFGLYGANGRPWKAFTPGGYHVPTIQEIAAEIRRQTFGPWWKIWGHRLPA